MEIIFEKIQKSDLQQPPKFCEFALPNFGPLRASKIQTFFLAIFTLFFQILRVFFVTIHYN